MKWTIPALGAAAVLAVVTLFFYTPATSDYARPFIPTPTSATIIFGGDMMFDRTIRTAMEEKGGDYVFSCIADLLKSADLVVANLEGPITAHPSKSVGSEIGADDNYVFTFPTSTAGLLARHNIKLVSLGNNHIMNFGREGLMQTRVLLDEAGVGHFGDLTDTSAIYRTSMRTIPLSFVGYNEFGGSGASRTLAAIRRDAAEGRMVIVYAHWGEEYEPPPARVKQLARSFVDAGAHIVVGSHPHIVQEHELYNGRSIYYSLGNMLFDQYWSEAVRRGLLLRLTFSPTGLLSVEEVPIDNQTDRRTCAV